MSRRLRRAMPFVVLAAGAAGAIALRLTAPEVSPKTPPPRVPLVRVVEVRPETIQLRVRAHGTVVPRTESELVAQVPGEVVWTSPSLVSGGFFRRGDPLVRLDAVDYELEVESARAAVARATSEFDRARTERERQRGLRERGVTSQARIDDTENAFRVAEAALREARTRLARAERDLARTELRAPFAGRVRSERVDAGQFVGRGASLATLYAVDYAEVRIPLPDRELRDLEIPLVAREGAGAEGAPQAEVRLSAEFAGQPHEWKGRIVRTEGEIDPRSRMVTVVARVEDPYGLQEPAGAPPLAVGLFVEAEILGRTVPGVFALPREALREAPGEEENRVYVIDPEDRLRIRRVEVLRAERERVLVTDGIAPGERIAVSPLPAAVEGMTVRVVERAPEGGPGDDRTATGAPASAS